LNKGTQKYHKSPQKNDCPPNGANEIKGGVPKFEVTQLKISPAVDRPDAGQIA